MGDKENKLLSTLHPSKQHLSGKQHHCQEEISQEGTAIQNDLQNLNGDRKAWQIWSPLY